MLIKLLILSLILPSSANAQECRSFPHQSTQSGKVVIEQTELCIKRLPKEVLLYSKSCETSSCDLRKKLAILKEKTQIFPDSFGSPHFHLCHSLEASPKIVHLTMDNEKIKTMLCTSPVDQSVMNTEALYEYWSGRDQ